MYIVAIAWIYVVAMMALAEALSSGGTPLGAVITFVMYGVLPLSVLMYILSTPRRRARLRAAEANASPAGPDHGRQAPADAIRSKREEL